MTAAPKGTVVVVGSLNTDYVMTVDRRPRAGETVTDGVLEVHRGGKGANQALAAAHTGARVAMVGKMGADSMATEHLRALSECDVDVTWVFRSPGTATGCAFVLVTPNGENSIAVAPGANSTLTPADLDLAKTTIAGARVLVSQLELPTETVEYAARLCSRETMFVLNCAPFRQLSSGLLGRIDILVANEHEASEMVGRRIAAPEAAIDASHAIAERGPRAVVITLGDQGAVVHTASRSDHVAAPPVEVVDTTGAGDAFVGALAARLSMGDSVTDAVGMAVVVGTATTVTRGPAAKVPVPMADGPRHALN